MRRIMASSDQRIRRASALRASIRKVLFAGLICSLAPQFGFAALPEDEFVTWPDRGFFPAYPKEETQDRLTLYSTLDIGYDDNYFRLSDAPGVSVFGSTERDEFFAILGVGAIGRFDVSRQEFNFDANVERYMYDQFSQLDTWLYAADANWVWRIGDRLHGDVGYSRSQRLPDFADQQFASDDVILQQQGYASIAIRLLSRVEARARAEETRYEHDNARLAELDNRVRSGIVGLVYTSPIDTTVGVEYRESRGSYPTRQAVGTAFIDNRYEEREASFIFDKAFDSPGGFDLRAAHTERIHRDVPQRDFDGPTGRVHLRYAMRPKVTFDIAGYREIRAIEEISSSYAVVDGGNAGPAWALTSKIVLQGSYIYEKREFGGDPRTVLTRQPPREDRTRAARVAVGYQPSLHLQFGLSYERGIRDANILFADYEYNLMMLHIVASL